MRNVRRSGLNAALRRGPVATRLRELKRATHAGQPDALMGPLEDVLASRLFRRSLDHPAYQQASVYAGALGFSHSKMRKGPSGAALQALSVLEELAPPDCPPRPRAVPQISGFEAFLDDLTCCGPAKGGPITGAPPGTFVRIVGSGFGPEPSDNVVTFGENRASILKASESHLVVLVPVPGLHRSDQAARFDRDSLKVAVSTERGSDTAEFEVSDFAHVPEQAFENFGSGFKRLLAKVNGTFAIHAPTLDRFRNDEEGADIALLLGLMPVLSGQTARALELLPMPLSVTGSHQPEFRRLLDGVVGASGVLADIAHAESLLDDPETRLLVGSGLLDAICTVQEVLHKTVLVLLLVLTILLVLVLVVLLIIAGLGPAGWVIDAVIIALLLAIPVVIFEWICIVITVVEIVHLAYEAVDWLFRKLTGSGLSEGGHDGG